MNNFKQKNILAFILALTATASWPAQAFAASPIEREGASIQKKYVNSDSVTMNCNSKKTTSCALIAKINGMTRVIKVDFAKYSIKPSFDRIRLYVLAEDGKEFSFVISTYCEDADIELLPSTINSAECMADFYVVNGEIKGSPTIQIYPIASLDLYRKKSKVQP